MSNLAKRIATAAVLVPMVVAAIFLDPTHYAILLLSIAAVGIAGDEYLRMALPVSAQDRAVGIRLVFAGSCTAVTALSFVYTPARSLPPVLTVSAITLCVAVLLRKRHLPQAGRHMAIALGGLLYVPMMACVWPLLVQLESGGAWLLLALGTAFLSDTTAYFVGRALGRHKLYEAVSPNKTREGALGGLLGGVLAQLGLGTFWLLPELPVAHAVALGLVGSVLGQIGDLVQSMTKRTFGVKDSGNILPGHGGMLDRVDGLIFVAPMVYYYATLGL